MYGNKIHNYGDEFNDGGENGIVGGLENLAYTWLKLFYCW